MLILTDVLAAFVGLTSLSILIFGINKVPYLIGLTMGVVTSVCRKAMTHVVKRVYEYFVHYQSKTQHSVTFQGKTGRDIKIQTEQPHDLSAQYTFYNGVRVKSINETQSLR